MVAPLPDAVWDIILSYAGPLALSRHVRHVAARRLQRAFRTRKALQVGMVVRMLGSERTFTVVAGTEGGTIVGRRMTSSGCTHTVWVSRMAVAAA